MKKYILSLFAVLSIHIFSFSQVNLTKGLVAYYPFNGNTNDESGNKNHPSVIRTSFTADRFGKANSACYFNGKDTYLQIKNNASLSPTEITLFAIVKPAGFYQGICYNNSIIDKGEWDYQPGNYSLRFTSGEYTKGDCYNGAFDHQNFVGMTAGNGGSTSKDIYVTPGKWYCVAYTFSREISKLYIDGQLISTYSPKGSMGKNNEDIFIGKKDNEQYPYWFKGVMDEVRIYNRVLNSQEIAALCGKPPSTKPDCTGPNKPDANFTYTVTDCNTIKFNLSAKDKKTIKEVKWMWGDGNSSTQLSPVHTYNKYGVYKVKAIVTNQYNCKDTAVKEIIIKELTTDFIVIEQDSPGEIQVKAKTNKAAYSWSFDDGSKEQDAAVVSHTFTESRQYKVQMFAQNNSGCRDTVVKMIDILLPQPIVAETVEKETTNPIPIAEPVKMEPRTKDVVINIPVINDSVSISLYDNGIIDGDSITLVYNGEVILSKQVLTAKPLNIRLKMDKKRETNELVMYAENLGSIPPNTALMIINDGDNRHSINVSSTKISNGTIWFTPKK